ncbi:MAG: respiratory nitrate reductase subunit gamma [Elusimicrobia bacterium]|nr:respiratory nitrate reductase subunit gamma [Elusimicrobiota bacterium]
MNPAYPDTFLFAIFPYVALAVCAIESLRRYYAQPFTYSSLSSQFLENQYHFWGIVPFHFGLMAVLAGHLAAFFVPRTLLLWNSVPARLYLLEATGFIFALLALIGLTNLIVRRITEPALRVVTTPMDWVVLALLAGQISLGAYIALFRPWGSSWFAASLTPYLWSLLKLSPDLSYVATMPLTVKLHITGAFALAGLLPFTRLVHLLVMPLPYLWRRPQVVRWTGPRRIQGASL